MPYITEWIYPDMFLAYKDHTIYRAYEDDEYSKPLEYWFSTDETEDEDGEYYFDIRDIESDLVEKGIIPEAVLTLSLDRKDAIEIIKLGIDYELIKFPEE